MSARRTVGAAGRLGFSEVRLFHLLLLGSVKSLFKYRLGLVNLELGLEVLHGSETVTVGAAPSVREMEFFIDDFVTRMSPVAFASAVLLGLLGVGIDKTVLAKEARQMLLRGGTLGVAGMMLVSVLVGTSHFPQILLSRGEGNGDKV